ncbi:hypothetical protein LCGC14_1890280 [marine sediment metagenome]|uniref:Uncharacterized protein n=1 Tax=marine sediment metagenome TaxID=412755 RepID=A0A0F9IDL4_9ZZZZ
MPVTVRRLLIESTDVKFLGRLIDFLNNTPVEKSSTVVRVLEDEVREAAPAQTPSQLPKVGSGESQ